MMHRTGPSWNSTRGVNMLDHLSLKLARPLLESTAKTLAAKNISADQVTISGFFVGMAGIAAIATHYYVLALALILINRLADGVDGTLARITDTTDSGAYLDIILDFIFYSGVVFGFALADPGTNSLAAAALIFSFVGTGSSFLAYAIMAERHQLTDLRLPDKGFYYLGGLAEGTETVLFFILFCLFPGAFSTLAWIFTCACWLSTSLRIIYAYRSLKSIHKNKGSTV